MYLAINDAGKLKRAADEAYDLHPKSCSHAVWHVMKQYIPGRDYVMANDLLTHLECNPRWIRVTVGELEKYANEGVLIVGGLAGEKNGHVVVVYPGKAKPRGGFNAMVKGKLTYLPPQGPTYALLMSTSMSGSWPGTMSKGDKTVRDAWSEEDFAKVRFWRFDPTAVKLPPVC